MLGPTPSFGQTTVSRTCGPEAPVSWEGYLVRLVCGVCYAGEPQATRRSITRHLQFVSDDRGSIQSSHDRYGEGVPHLYAWLLVAACCSCFVRVSRGFPSRCSAHLCTRASMWSCGAGGVCLDRELVLRVGGRAWREISLDLERRSLARSSRSLRISRHTVAKICLLSPNCPSPTIEVSEFVLRFVFGVSRNEKVMNQTHV
jgi:hypothetical protein